MLSREPDKISVYASSREWSREARHVLLRVPPPPGLRNDLDCDDTAKDRASTVKEARKSPALWKGTPGGGSGRGQIAYTAVAERN
jgi:hypothetical protein